MGILNKIKKQIEEDIIKDKEKNDLLKEHRDFQLNAQSTLECPVCHSKDFDSCVLIAGEHVADNAFVNTEQFDIEHKFCINCGYIMSFISFKK